MYLPMDKIIFGEWLRKEREKRDWSQSDLARFSGLHRQIINKTENGVSEPALKTYIALSDAFNIPLISILRSAGELPQGPDDEISLEDWKHLLSQMTQSERDEMREIGVMKIERRKKEQSIKTLKTKKAG